jgi:hypothetical protein
MWDATTRQFSCGRDIGANVKTTSGTTPIALTPASTKVRIGVVTTTPATTASEVWITGSITATNTAASVRTISVTVFRGDGMVNNCGAPGGVQVGATTTVAIPAVNGLSQEISFNIVDAPATSTAESYTLCAQASVASASVTSFQITAQEVNVGADLAEVYYSSQDEFTPGDVVSLDPTSDGRIQFPTRTYDSKALGVVSTKPGLVMSNEERGEGVPYLIALAGRIPVKISLENGPIEPGDPLTAATRPGYAMKATQPGQIIGRALSALSGNTTSTETGETNTGMVMMFAQNGYYVPSLEEETSGEGVVILDDAGNGEDVVVPTVSEDPTFRISDHAEFEGEVSVLKHFYVGEDAAGYAKFLMNSKEIRVSFKDHYLYPPVVNVTPQAEVRSPYWIEQVDETGFTIRMAEGIDDRDIEFAWIVSAVKEPILYVSDGTSGKRSEEDAWRGIAVPVEEPTITTTTPPAEESPTEEETAPVEEPSASEEPVILLPSEGSSSEPEPVAEPEAPSAPESEPQS